MDKDTILKITWVDSYGKDGWQYGAQCLAEVAIIETIGYFVDENKEGICIAHSRGLTEGASPYGNLLTIPKTAIKKKERLSE